MRYTLFLLLGLVLVVLQGETWIVLGPLAARGFRPSLLVPLLVYVAVSESNLALAASVGFLLGYVLDVIGGAPIGLYAFTSVATVALARLAGLRIVTQSGWARAVLAGAFAGLGTLMVIVLLAIFGKGAYVPRAMFRLILPHAAATIVFAPLVFRAAARVSAIASGLVEPREGKGSLSASLPPRRVPTGRDERRSVS